MLRCCPRAVSRRATNHCRQHLWPGSASTEAHDVRQTDNPSSNSRRYVRRKESPGQQAGKSLIFPDVPIILSLIEELAAFENAPDSVEATETSLRLTLSFAPSSHHHHRHHHDHKSASDHGHNSQPPPDRPFSSTSHAPPTQTSGYAKTLLITAQPEDEVAGMALYFHNYSTWRAKPGIYLEDLFVSEKYRRRGYATLLLRELAKEVTRIEGGRLEWSCLKWNQDALDFYERLGAKQMDEWVGLRVDGEALVKLAKGQVDEKKVETEDAKEGNKG